ncbi:FG-GAP repeat protein [Streptomyces sp. NPDC056656]|uniref:FG-GAP and VCBS repeat-containing protein n=1 Tax=Streptomyces sp. NPDC056656 TaxID=3345895 RepID=UPI0036A39891
MSRAPRNHRRLSQALIACGCAVTLLAGCSEGDAGEDRTADPAPRVPTGRGAGERGLGDFDRDGYDDFVTSLTTRNKFREPTGYHLLVLPGSAKGLDPGRRRTYRDFFYGPLLRADLNGDGYTDLVATQTDHHAKDPARRDDPGTAVILPGGKKGLGDPIPVKAAGLVMASAATDVDGDGAVDLVYAGHHPDGKDTELPDRQGLVAYGPFGTDAAPARTAELKNTASPSQATSGDFDGDGYGDVMFTDPSPGEEDADPPADNGPYVTYFRGGPRGLTPARPPGNLGNDTYDGVLVPRSGDVDGDGIEDILAPGYREVGVAEGPASGRLTVAYGSKSGAGGGRANAVFDQETPGVPGDSQGKDGFGRGAGTGDVNGDGHPDLLVDTPGEDQGNGRFTLLPGGPDGSPTGANASAFDLDTPGVPGKHDPSGGDGFAATFPLLDVNGDGRSDVVANAPGYRRGKGGLWLFPGTPEGLGTAGRIQFLDPSGLGLPPRTA